MVQAKDLQVGQTIHHKDLGVVGTITSIVQRDCSDPTVRRVMPSYGKAIELYIADGTSLLLPIESDGTLSRVSIASPKTPPDPLTTPTAPSPTPSLDLPGSRSTSLPVHLL